MGEGGGGAVGLIVRCKWVMRVGVRGADDGVGVGCGGENDG